MARTYETNPAFTTPKRGRRGHREPRYAILPASKEIPVADCLVGVDEDGYIKLASEYATVDAFLLEFAGVAPDPLEAADKDRRITIFATGNYEFDCDAGVYPVGRAVEPVVTAGAVENRKVALAADAGDVIGAVASHTPDSDNWMQQAGATTVEVAIRARRMLDGWIPAP